MGEQRSGLSWNEDFARAFGQHTQEVQEHGAELRESLEAAVSGVGAGLKGFVAQHPYVTIGLAVAFGFVLGRSIPPSTMVRALSNLAVFGTRRTRRAVDAARGAPPGGNGH